MRRKGCWTYAELSLVEGLNLLWWFGLTKSFLFWNSSACQNKDEILENEGKFEHWFNMKFSSEASRRWPETWRVMGEVGKSS
jgi:hypothetical protein